MTFSKKCQLVTGIGVGVILSTIGAILSIFWSTIFDKVLNNELALSESSKSFELWEEVPLPVHVEFYFFNWTNPEEIYNHSSKPILVEVGPYVFREERRKIIRSWNRKNSTVTFYQNRTWYFEPALSNGTLDDEIQTINVPGVYAPFVTRKEVKLIKYLVNTVMNIFSTKISVIRTVRELTFDGYQDPLLYLLKFVPPSLFPTRPPFDKFGWFAGRNNSDTYDGLFNMYTGKGDMKKFGSIGTWNYENPTSIYESYCGKANGSAGEMFPPKLEKTKISIFIGEMCRSLDLSYKEEVTADGIKGYRYWGDEKLFLNHSSAPDNWCFCPSGECAPHGAIDVSSCRWMAPLFISFPHFLHGDLSYRNAVVGMNPIESKHQLSVDLEPRTGIAINVAAALQLNILIQPFPEFTLTKDLPKIYFPVVWIKQTARLDEDTRSLLQLVVKIPLIGTIVFYIILGLGILMLAATGFYWFLVRKGMGEENMILVKD